MPPESATPPATDRISEAGPPAGALVYSLVNPLMKVLLRSPLHFLVSDMLMLITFTGRKTGATYTTPVGYHRDGDTLIVFTHSDWWKNLRGGQRVTLRLRGHRERGLANPRTDPEEVARYVKQVIDENGVDSARRIGLRIEGEEPPTREELEQALDTTVVIEIVLDDENAAHAG